MEDSTAQNIPEVVSSTEAPDSTEQEKSELISDDISTAIKNSSQSLFPDSPVYEPEDDAINCDDPPEMDTTNETKEMAASPGGDSLPIAKRKLLDQGSDVSEKKPKLDVDEITDENTVSSQTLNDEVSLITDKAKIEPTARLNTPVRSSPRKITKRSNSVEASITKTPTTPKSRSASTDITKSAIKVHKLEDIKELMITDTPQTISSDSTSRPSVEFVAEIKPKMPETIDEEVADVNDSQDFHLALSPASDTEAVEKPKIDYNSDPVVVKDRKEILEAGKIQPTRSEGYNYSDLSNNQSQKNPSELNLEKTTDQESTDSLCSFDLDSSDHVPNVASKTISKLSNGNTSTPTEVIEGKNTDDCTGLGKLNGRKGKLGKNESFEAAEKPKIEYNSDPVFVKDRKEILEPGKIQSTKSEGYNCSDSNNQSQKLSSGLNQGKTTDQESTDSVSSFNLDSPDHVPTVASKMISKLSNGNSSTPTEVTDGKNTDDCTPELGKLNGRKGKLSKNESFRASNTTTPSTISPLQNGHSLPGNTPQIPVFDVHVSHNEDCEFLSLYVVRTDNDVGMDMCREYQRISKRFSTDPYMADVSVNTSPSSVTSAGMINLPARISFASTVSSSSTSSNRTTDGQFVVPHPPRKSVGNPTVSVKGYEALMKKLHDIFSHMPHSTEDSNRSIEEKVSVAVQTQSEVTNGSASPEEVIKCDKATPKSSLRKTRVKGRRHMAGKTKRAILPTQPEEPDMRGMNSPEMVPTDETGKTSPKDEKPLSSLVGTPKSVTKLKQKRRPTSPRPATPVERTIKPEYPGYAADTVVLAKWVDKRYYSGKVLEITEPNKYLIKFDDGQSKVLLDDFIIFGDMKKLPLQGQSVYALVDEEQNYEPGLVLGVEENDNGTVTYRCTTDGDTIVMVTASELYLTEDQARWLKESARPNSPAAPTTPRRRHHRELDLDNIIQGPRSARSRDKGNSSARKRVASPKSPKASTSGVKTKTPVARKRLASESSEMSESSNSAPLSRLEEVAGVEPEVQRTPRKIDGVKAGPLQLKGAAKQNIGKKNSKLTKFENDEDTCSTLGPIPTGIKLFEGLHFLLTCTEPPRREQTQKFQESRHYSSEEDSEATSGLAGTDTEDLVFCNRPFNKERLREQLEAGGGVVHSHFDDVPKAKYSSCKLIAPRPCLTAKYIQCLAADIRAVTHEWVIMSCIKKALLDTDAHALPAGWSIMKGIFINWIPSSGRRNPTFFKDKLILLCGDHNDTFVKFWDRVCTLAGASTRVVNEEELNMSGAIALVTELDCPHEVQNKANQDNIPLVSTTWIVQCLIEAKVIAPTSHDKFSFMYTEPE